MIDRILNGLGDSSSSRSGAATTYDLSTPSGKYTGLTKGQYDAWKAALDHFTNAYGIAYSYDLTAPNWSEFTMTNGQFIVDSYVQMAINSGKSSKSESWAAFVAERVAQQQALALAAAETAMNVAIGAQYTSLEERANAIRAAVENAAKVVATKVYYDEIAKGTNSEIAKREADRAEYAYYNEHWEPIRQAEIDVVNSTPAATQPPPQTTRQNINIPEPTNVQTLPSNGEEKKGSGLLVPGLILAAGIVAAILLTKKSRR